MFALNTNFSFRSLSRPRSFLRSCFFWRMETKQEGEMQFLPPEIVSLIFSFMDLKALARASMVSHEWRELATDTLWFAVAYQSDSQFKYDLRYDAHSDNDNL